MRNDECGTKTDIHHSPAPAVGQVSFIIHHLHVPYPRIEQLFLVPGKTNADAAQWGAAALEYAALFPGVFVSNDINEAARPHYERVTVVNPDYWPEEFWTLIKQNPRPIILEQLTAPAPEVLAEVLHVRTYYGLRFGFQTEYDWSQQWPLGMSLIGLHGRGDGEFQEADYDVVRRSRVEGVKLLSYASGNTVKALKTINPSLFIIMRPTLSFWEDNRARRVTPEEFVSGTAHDMQRQFDADPSIRYLEVHNEPNMTVEGFGASWADGREFASWFDRVVELYRERWPDKKYGFPGLSPGVLNHIRVSSLKQFLGEAALSAARADWIAVHGYWSSDREMTDTNGGFTWKIFREMFPDKLLIITEFGNPAQSKPIVAEQYSRYYGILRHVPGLGGAYAYISSISDRTESARWAWRDESGKDAGIADEIGLRRHIR
ncbi:MAG TPA: hypothetical protein VI547_06280 [Anaerolineales bacterium]|nr:hypothetical protein [Anaerolineales bacterium]